MGTLLSNSDSLRGGGGGGEEEEAGRWDWVCTAALGGQGPRRLGEEGPGQQPSWRGREETAQRVDEDFSAQTRTGASGPGKGPEDRPSEVEGPSGEARGDWDTGVSKRLSDGRRPQGRAGERGDGTALSLRAPAGRFWVLDPSPRDLALAGARRHGALQQGWDPRHVRGGMNFRKPPAPAAPCCMISTICTTLSMCFRAAISPCSISIL